MVTEKTAAESAQRLRDYELVLVFKPDSAEEKLEVALNNLGKFVADRGGAVSEVQRWGRRKLAYPIKSSLEGIYFLAKLKLRSATGKELESNLRVSEDVLRHLLINLES
ncbi:MAG: 30S ribosomal protein S6 [Chloroflexi bacterium]|nr:30S ribosomal protein S6 [Chloroflexota bacterium]